MGSAGEVTAAAESRRRGTGRALDPLIVAAVGVGACVVLLASDPTVPGGFIPTCPSKALFGVVCPGCGSCRMIYSLLHGDLRSAVRFNALGLLALPVLAWSYLVWTLSRWGVVELPRWERYRHAPLVVGVLVGIWFVVRNIPVPPFLSLRV